LGNTTDPNYNICDERERQKTRKGRGMRKGVLRAALSM
jgi:hypothetical protein